MLRVCMLTRGAESLSSAFVIQGKAPGRTVETPIVDEEFHMRSQFELHCPALEQELARSGRRLSARDLHQMAREQRALAIGEMIGAAIEAVLSLARRAARWMTAGPPSYIPPWRS